MEPEKLGTLQIIEKYNLLVQEVRDLETALKSLRNKQAACGQYYRWDQDIEKDTRAAVQTLYATYTDAKNRLNEFQERQWAEV